MSKYYAVIDGGIVTSIIVWDGSLDISGSGLNLIPVGEHCIVGSTYSDGVFNLPPVPENTEE